MSTCPCSLEALKQAYTCSLLVVEYVTRTSSEIPYSKRSDRWAIQVRHSIVHDSLRGGFESDFVMTKSVHGTLLSDMHRACTGVHKRGFCARWSMHNIVFFTSWIVKIPPLCTLKRLGRAHVHACAWLTVHSNTPTFPWNLNVFDLKNSTVHTVQGFPGGVWNFFMILYLYGGPGNLCTPCTPPGTRVVLDHLRRLSGA